MAWYPCVSSALGAARLVLMAVSIGAVACSSTECEGEDCECTEGQRRPDGTCCPAWSAADGFVCVVRPVLRPAPGETFGNAGVEDIQLSVDGEAQGLATWIARSADGNDRLVIAQEIDSGWSLDLPAAGFPGFAVDAHPATGTGRSAVVAWTQRAPQGEGVFVSSRDDNGWTHPTADAPLSLTALAAQAPTAKFNTANEAFVAWNQWRGDGFSVALASRPSGAESFSRPDNPDGLLSPPSGSTRRPSLALANNGDAVVLWIQHDGSTQSVFASERTGPQGAFSRPSTDQALPTPSFAVDPEPAPVVVPAASDWGHVAAVWTQDQRPEIRPVYFATRDGFGNWEFPTDLDDSFSQPLGWARDPSIAFGRGTALFIVWRRDAGRGPEVLAAHRNDDGVWTAPGDAPAQLSTPGYETSAPALAVGSRGQALVVWAERSTGPWRVMMRRRTAGADRWTTAQRVSPDDDQDSVNPVAAIGATGRAIIAWAYGPDDARRAMFATIESSPTL